MEWQDLLADGCSQIPEFMEKVLSGLNEDDLNWQPRQDCNSISWLLWHLTHQQDAQIASLIGEEQLWVKDGWHAKFNRPPDPEDSGFGHTTEQVAAFKSLCAQTLLDSQRAVVERSKRYFQTLSKTDLEHELDEPWFQPLPTLGMRPVSILEDSMLHAGQAAYIRSLRQGKGWQKY